AWGCTSAAGSPNSTAGACGPRARASSAALPCRSGFPWTSRWTVGRRMAKPARVLVVEDEASVGQVVVDVLADEGHEVRWATNGRDALALLDHWRPDVIVLDLMMPVMDGRAFRAAQQRLPDTVARVPVVVLSGMREARATADELG